MRTALVRYLLAGAIFALSVKAFAEYPNESFPDSLLNKATHSNYLKGKAGTGFQNQPHAHGGYIAVAGNGTHMFVDAEDPYKPKVMQVVQSPYRTGVITNQYNQEQEGHTLSFAKYPDGKEYMVTVGGRGFDIWDVTDIAAGVTHVKSQDIPGIKYGDVDGAIWGLAWQGKYIYVGATNNGLYVVDASDINNLTDAVSPSSPTRFEAIPTRNWRNIKVGPVFPLGNLMAFGAPKDANGVAMLDISNPGSPVTLDTQNCATSKTYITWFYGRWMFCEERIAIYDVVSDPKNIKHIVTANGPASEYMSFGDDHLFLGALRPNPGIYKYDLTNISRPKRVGKVVNQHTKDKKEDDQFSVPIGNVLFISDDEHDRGGFIAVHDTNKDTKPPRVMYANPENGSSNHSTRTRIGISFSDQIDLRSVDTSTLSLREMPSGTVIDGYFGINHTIVHFAPTDDLKPNTDYELHLPAGGITDLVGNGLDQDYVFSFSTGTAGSTGSGGMDIDVGNGGMPINSDTPWQAEAEDMTMSDGVLYSADNAGYSGDGYADFPVNGGELSSTFSSVTVGQNTLTIAYANGGAGARTLNVRVGDVNLGSVDFPSTGGWTQWNDITLPVTISAASVAVSLTGNGTPGPNVDSVGLKGKKEDAVPVATVPPTCSIEDVAASETNRAVTFTTPAQANVKFTWTFGEKKYENAMMSQSHTFTEPGRYTVSLAVANSAGVKQCAVNHIVHNALTANRPTRSSQLWVDEALGRVWTVNPDNDTVSALDQKTLTKAFEVAVGKDPRSIAKGGDGNVWVVNHDDASISILSATSGQLVRTIDLPYASQPVGIVFTPNGTKAFVSLQSLGQILALDGTTGQEIDRLTLRRDTDGTVPKPRALAVSGDGGRLLVTRFISNDSAGHLYEIDATTLSLINVIELAIDPGKGGDEPDDTFHSRGLPNYLTGVTISPDGSKAWITAKKDNIERGLFSDGREPTFDSTVRPLLAPVDLLTGKDILGSRIDFNDSDSPSASVFSPLGDLVFTALQGNNQVHIYDWASGESVGVLETGDAPQALELDSEGRLYVHNFIARSISVFDASGLIAGTSSLVPELAVVPMVANEKLSAKVLKGKLIFYSSKSRKMSQDNYISCATCHLDGGEDGRVLDFANRGEGMRNTITMRGRKGTGHGPVHWTGNFDEIQDFEHDIRGPFGGAGFIEQTAYDHGTVNTPLGDMKTGLSEDLDAMAAYVESLDRVPDSPYRNADGGLSRMAQAGKAIYESLDCSDCHSGPEFTDSALNVHHDVGTISMLSGNRLDGPLPGFDTPTLKGVWNTPPYFHDGSAKNLHQTLDVVGHGNAQGLTATEKDQLVRYMLELDDNPQFPSAIVKPGDENIVIPTPGDGTPDPDTQEPEETPAIALGRIDAMTLLMILLLALGRGVFAMRSRRRLR